MLLVERFRNNVSHKGRRCARPVRRANAGDAVPIGELAQRCRPRCSGDRLQRYFGNVLLAPDQVSPTARTRIKPPSRRCWTLSSSRASFRNWSAWRRPDNPLTTRNRKGLAERPPHEDRKRKPARCRLKRQLGRRAFLVGLGWAQALASQLPPFDHITLRSISFAPLVHALPKGLTQTRQHSSLSHLMADCLSKTWRVQKQQNPISPEVP